MWDDAVGPSRRYVVSLHQLRGLSRRCEQQATCRLFAACPCQAAHPADEVAIWPARLGLSPGAIPLQGLAGRAAQARQGHVGTACVMPCSHAELLACTVQRLACCAGTHHAGCRPPGQAAQPLNAMTAPAGAHLPEEGTPQGVPRLQALLNLALDHVKPGTAGEGIGPLSMPPPALLGILHCMQHCLAGMCRAQPGPHQGSRTLLMRDSGAALPNSSITKGLPSSPATCRA